MESKTNKLIVCLLALIVFFVPSVSAYVQTTNTWSLWDIFVENIFGSFWPAVIVIGFFFFIVLMLGGISLYTVIVVEMYYLYAMALGYGYSLLTVPITVFAILYSIWQAIKFFESR